MSTFSHNGILWHVTSCTATKLVVVPAANKEELARIREKLGLNTRDMAARLKISQSKLSKLETGDQWRSLPAVLEAARKISK